jgi:hypothetical protein
MRTSSFGYPSSCVAQRFLRLDRLQEVREPRDLVLIERDSALRDTGFVPNAEADVRVSRQVTRHPKRLAGVARMWREELDNLASLS